MDTTSDIPIRNRDRSPGVRLAIYIVGFVVAAMPILLLENLPFTDYSNHLARYYILHNIDQSAELAQFYSVKDGYYPYWAMRLVISALSGAMSTEDAGRIFVLLATLVPAAGAIALSSVMHGRLTLVPFAALAFVNNIPMSWGFQNYLLSSGLALFAFAFWIKAERWSAFVRVGVFAPVAMALASLHLLAAGVFIILVGTWELGTVITTRRWRHSAVLFKFLEIGVLCLPALVVMFALRGQDLGLAVTLDGGIRARLEGLYSVLWTGNSTTELIIGVWLAGLLLSALWLGILELPRTCWWFLALMTAMTLAAPFALFGVTYINVRLPVILCLVLIACCRPAKPPGKRFITGSAVFLILASAKLAVSALELKEKSDQITEFRTASLSLPTATRIFSAIDQEVAKQLPGYVQQSYYQLLPYTIVDRNAFIPRLFTMYEIGLSPKFFRLGRAVSKPIDLSLMSKPASEWNEFERAVLGYAINWREDYDYVVLIDFGAGSPHPAGTQLMHRGSYFQILKIIRPA